MSWVRLTIIHAFLQLHWITRDFEIRALTEP